MRTERDSLEEITVDLVNRFPQRTRNYHPYQFHAENEAWKEVQRKEQEERMELEKEKREAQKDKLENEFEVKEIDELPKQRPLEKPDTIKEEILPENPKVELSTPNSKSVLENLLARKKLKEENSANRLNQDETDKLILARKKLDGETVEEQRIKPIEEVGDSKTDTKSVEKTTELKKNVETIDEGVLQNPEKSANKINDKHIKKDIRGLRREQETRKKQEKFDKNAKIKAIQSESEKEEKKEEPKTLLEEPVNQAILNSAWSKANGIKSAVEDVVRSAERDERRLVKYQVDIYMKLAQSIAVFVMFLIGAPLGAIIKKGGLGVPVLISIVFFVIYYISTIIGKKYAEEMVVSPFVGCWAGIGLLLLIGLFCMRQAYADARLFDFDYYTVQFNKLKTKMMGK